MLSPIALFVYNRPWHTRQTVESLKRNELASASELIIFSDAAKSEKNDYGVAKTREYIRSIKGFKSVEIVERKVNYGLARSIISGVADVVNKFGRIIVLEDDLITSAHFLRFMNDGLDIFENDERVISIHGYSYPVGEGLPDYYFLKGADCWSWATWKRGWDLFEPDGVKLLNELKNKNLTYRFDFNGAYPYTRMLEDQTKGINNSWAVRWYASAFISDKLTLYPGKSFVDNIGRDGSGVNYETGKKDHIAKSVISSGYKKISLENIAHSESAFNCIEKFHKKSRSESKTKKIGHIVKRVVKSLLPPLLAGAYNMLFKRKGNEPVSGFFGDYPSWESAVKDSSGYDSDVILEKVRNAVLKVKNGEAAYERDSVTFDKSEYSWPLVSCLLRIAAREGGKLGLIDFGGSLGSTYFQNVGFLRDLAELKWNVVEQKKFVECGREMFENDHLRFFYDIDESLRKSASDVILLSSVIQYVEAPYSLLDEIKKKRFKYILFDRTPFFLDAPDRILVQRVSPSIYEASYPTWIFNYEKFMDFFAGDYELITDFDGADRINVECKFKGFLFRKK